MSGVLRSRVLRVAAGAMVAALLVVAALHSPPVRVRALRALTAQIAEAGFVAHADAIDYNLATLTVHLSGVTMATPRAPDTPFFQAKELHASLPWRVLAGQFAIDSVEIVSPVVTLRRDAQGRDNWTTDPRDKAPDAAPALHIGQLTVRDLVVDWTDEQQSAHVDAALSLDLTADGKATTGAIALTRPARLRWRDRTTTVSANGGRVSWNDRDLAVQSLSLTAPEGAARLDGRIQELLGTPRVAAQIEADANLDRVSPWLNLEPPLTGTAKASAHVDDSGVEVASVRARVAGGEIAGRGRVSFDGAGSTQLTWNALDVPALVQLLVAEPPRVLPASVAAGSLAAQWTAPQLDGLTLTGNWRLRGNTAPARRSDPPVEAALQFELRDRAWKISADDVFGLGAQVKAALGGTVDPSDLRRTTVTGTLHAETRDQREWLDAIARAGWLDAVPPLRGGGAGDFTVSGTVGAPSLDGNVDATLQYQSMPAARIRTHAALTTDAVRLTDLDAQIANIKARGTLEWTAGSGAIAGALSGSLPLADLADFAPSIPRWLALSGSVDLSAALAGSIAQPRVAIRAAGSALQAAGQPIDRLSADVRVLGSDVTVDRLRLEQGSGHLDAIGTFDLDRNRYTVQATAADVQLRPLMEVNGERDTPLSGRVNASFEGSGTLTDPGGRGRVSIADTRWKASDIGLIGADVTLADRAATFTFDAADVALAGRGRISVDPSGPLAFSAAWEPADITAIARRLAIDLPLTGSVRAQLSADGTTADPRIAGALRVSNGRVPVADGHDVTDIEVSARYEQGVVTLERATAAYQGASLSATGRMPSQVFAGELPEAVRPYVPQVSGPATLSAQIGSITPSVAAPFVDAATLAEIGAHADAAIVLESDRLSLESVRGSATFGRAELSVAGVSFDQQEPTRLAARNGRVTVEAFRWGRESNQIQLQGGLTLSSDPALDLSARAALDLRLLNAFTTAARTTGRGDAEIRLGGTVSAPTVDGYLTVSGGEARVAEPRTIVGDVNGTITFASDTLTLHQLSATINGGEALLSGSLRHQGLTPVGGSLALTAKGAAFDLEGLRADSDAALTWTFDTGAPVLEGTVTLRRSAFRERLSVTGNLLSALRRSSPTPLRTPGTSLFDRTRLDVRLITDEDLAIDNNVARLAVRGDLRAVGTVARPSLTGRATVVEGGVVFFNGTRYRVDKDGSIDFANPNRIEPDLDVSAVARVAGNEITLALKGTPATLEPTLDSDNPSLSQSDLVSLLLIGKTLDDADASGSDELVGLLTSDVLEAAGRAIGFDTARVERGTPDVRFDAGLVAAETDPGARFTFGKSFGSHWDVVFSQSLQQSGSLTWIVGYKPRAGIDLRVVSLDDREHFYTFAHDLTFGGPARKTTAEAKPAARVSAVVITGAGGDEDALRARLKLRAADRFSFFEWQDDRERLEAFFRDRRRLQARVVARRTTEPADTNGVRLAYEIRPGPETTVSVDGFSPSKSTTTAIGRAWEGSVADEFLIDEAIGLVRADLADRGFLEPQIAARMDGDARARQLVMTVVPGARAADRRVEFFGNESEPPERLLAVLAERGLSRAVWTDPDLVRDALTTFYRANGFLNASVQVEPVSVSVDTAIRRIRIAEGGPFHVASVRLDGVRAIAPGEASAIAGVSAGDRYVESQLEAAQLALDAQYRARGYNRVAIDYEARVREADESRGVDVVVRVDEGPQQRLREVVTTGLSRTRPALVSRALGLEVGAPVDLAAWNAARRRVYATGAFRSVDIQREVLEGDAAAGDGDEPVRAKVTVQEWPPLRLRYGLEVRDQLASAGDAARSGAPGGDSSDGHTVSLGVAGDLSARGLFGTAVSAGVAGRSTLDMRASRAYLTAPSFFGLPIASTAFVERSREELGSQLGTGAPIYETVKTDLTLEQRIRARRKTTISYLYTLERNHTRQLDPDPLDPLPFDVTVTVGRFASTVLFDTRNDLSDPSRGWFHSSNLQYAPAALGSDLRFLKYFAQQHFYRTAGRVVFATGARLGLATAFDTTLTPDQRFFAGGGNSVRGYAEDVISPIDPFGAAVGGNALVVVNQEVRFPLFKIVRGVGFFDAGRAFDRVGDLSLRDLALGGGFGLRVQTPFVLLRADAGLPFDAAFGPRRLRWFFSIGQMF